ncbi:MULTISPECIES: MFS transporter [unclassified Brevibacterium]|uniref:MFS transporter n=1 Tax=unclassified Brevibacterium TaxID=2614124 RepID=UPI0010807E29|nr:MFS transporter [Brevibacterium sp. S111]TGD13124.1 MFS transporter [Brevibacterium sp. S111]
MSEGSQAKTPDPSQSHAATGWGLAASAYVFTVVMMGTTLPTPLYPLYEERFGFGTAFTTQLFAIYALGVIAALIVFGRLSDGLGRRPVLSLGVVFSVASAVLFLIGANVGLLLTGRVLSGLAAGIFTSTATVTVLENAPAGRERLAGSLATAANMGGLGLGILSSGLLAHFAAGPLFTPFLVNAIMLIIAGAALLLVRDRTRRQQRGTPGAVRLQLPGIPASAKRMFLAASPGAITGFAVCGLYSAVAPSFIGQTLHLTSTAVTGTVVFLLFGASASAQLVFRGLSDRRLIVGGTVTMIVSMGALVLALLIGSLPVLIVSSVLAGAGQGLVFMTGMRAITAATAPEHRTEATTSYFILAYVFMSVPAIGAGFLAAEVGLANATTIFAVAVAAVCVFGLVAARRFSAR